jgi:hypothetical protein
VRLVTLFGTGTPPRLGRIGSLITSTPSRSQPGPAALLDGFAGLAAEALQRARASLGRDELDAEFEAVYLLSQRLATLSREAEVRERWWRP